MQLTKSALEYIEARKKEYEERYNISIYTWFVRKSSIRGLQRETSDLDVVFLFSQQANTNWKIIFERADRRCEFQCWDLSAIMDIVVENKKRAMENSNFEVYMGSAEYAHYILDYYNGFYCSIGNTLKKSYYNYDAQIEPLFTLLYEPAVVAKLCCADLDTVITKLKTGYQLTLNQVVNAISSALIALHALNGNMPGEADIIYLSKIYLLREDAERVQQLVQVFRSTIQKQSNYGWFDEDNKILIYLREQIEIKLLDYKVNTVDVYEISKRIIKSVDNMQ